MRRAKQRPALSLVRGNPQAPAPMPRAALAGPVEVVRHARSQPDVDAVTLAAVTEDGTIIGTLSLPWECLDMEDTRWLQARAERLQQVARPSLTLLS